jgi:hypothetical protein
VGLGEGDTSVTVGGPTFGEGNLISGNEGDGLLLYRGATVIGNLIGMGTTEAPLGNGGNGILIKGPGNFIDGTDMANIITNNGLNGVAVISESGGATENRILSNFIYDNGSLGIAISEDAVIPNDLQDLDSGDNNRQNYPVLTSAVLDPVAGNTTYTGTLNAAPGTVYTVEIHSDAFCDPSGYGEGRAMIHSFTLTTNVNGQAMFSEVVPITYYEAGDVITSTATDPGGNTSEFSNCIPVTEAVAPAPIPTFHMTMNGNCRLGPSTQYAIVTSFAAGDSFEVGGLSQDSNWVYHSLYRCFVARSTGELEGSTDGLPFIPAPQLSVNCSNYTDQQSCTAQSQYCEWVTPLATQGRPYCRNR